MFLLGTTCLYKPGKCSFSHFNITLISCCVVRLLCGLSITWFMTCLWLIKAIETALQSKHHWGPVKKLIPMLLCPWHDTMTHFFSNGNWLFALLMLSLCVGRTRSSNLPLTGRGSGALRRVICGKCKKRVIEEVNETNSGKVHGTRKRQITTSQTGSVWGSNQSCR